MRKSLLLLALVALVSGFASAGSSEEAIAWLDKLHSAAEKSFRARYVADVRSDQMGQAMEVHMEGDHLQADPTHTRSVVTAKMKMEMMPDGVSVDVVVVSDGTTMWTEMNNPMMGGKQVLKIGLDQIEELAQKNPEMASMQGTDPFSQIRKMADSFDFIVAETGDGQVVLQADLSGDDLKSLGQILPDGAPAAMTRLTIVLDEKSGLPRSMQLGSDPALMRMRFEELEFVGRDSLDDAMFTYTPAEGVSVMDLGAMLNSLDGAR